MKKPLKFVDAFAEMKKHLPETYVPFPLGYRARFMRALDVLFPKKPKTKR